MHFQMCHRKLSLVYEYAYRGQGEVLLTDMLSLFALGWGLDCFWQIFRVVLVATVLVIRASVLEG